MPARRKPLHVLEAVGALRKDPKRYAGRTHETAWPSDPLGPPPDCLDDNMQAIWHELVSEAPEGVLRGSDRAHVELTVRLLARQRTTPEQIEERIAEEIGECYPDGASSGAVASITRSVNREMKMTPGYTRVLMKCLADMRMNPVSRS